MIERKLNKPIAFIAILMGRKRSLGQLYDLLWEIKLYKLYYIYIILKKKIDYLFYSIEISFSSNQQGSNPFRNDICSENQISSCVIRAWVWKCEVTETSKIGENTSELSISAYIHRGKTRRLSQISVTFDKYQIYM